MTVKSLDDTLVNNFPLTLKDLQCDYCTHIDCDDIAQMIHRPALNAIQGGHHMLTLGNTKIIIIKPILQT